jgi:hypothetical protein
MSPDSPAGRGLAWYLESLAQGRDDILTRDADRFVASLRRPSVGLGDLRGIEIAGIEEASPFSVTATLLSPQGKRWRLTFSVEAEEPHVIRQLDWQRLFDCDVTVREATEADAPTLARLERRSPVVLGESSVAFDRGDDYFAFTRLMAEVTVAVGFVGGEPAAVNCGAVHPVRIGGQDVRVMTAIHTRVLPEHQGKGLWGAVSRVLGEKYNPGTAVETSRGFVSADNAAMQRGFANVPNKWSIRALRAQLDCAALAGPAAGRPATPADADQLVEILNRCHEGEEMYLPYTADSLAQRLERAPAQYSWERLWLGDGAVVGVWPAGESTRLLLRSHGREVVSRRGLVLDYGFAPGREEALEGLLRAWCALLAERQLDTLSIFTSESSPGYDVLTRLAYQVDAFDLWTPGRAEPPGAAERGLYVDQVYF